MIRIFCGFVTAIIFTAAAIFLIIKLSNHLKLFDDTDNYRKKHRWLVPRLGGAGMIFGAGLTFPIFWTSFSIEINAMLGSTIVLVLLGFKDDLLGGAKPLEKFFMQFIASIILTTFGKLGLTVYPWIVTVDFYSEIVLQLLSVLVIVFLINSFNLIDGIDGLAGIISLIVNLYLSFKLYQFGSFDFAFIGIVVCGATMAFLRFNILERKIFMGDAGAMLLGLISASLGFKFIQYGNSTSVMGYQSPGAIVFALLIVPVFDSTRISLIRIIQKKSLFLGDRNHVHHRIKDLGMSDLKTVAVLSIFTLCASAYSIVFQSLGLLSLLISIFMFAVVGNSILTYLRGVHLSNDYRLVDILLKDTLGER
ncbi:MAG: MraY family glycosyltransferase [Bacteroidota bacterium]